MNQYFHGFITAICLSVSFVMFTASQKSNLGDITVNSIRVVDNQNGGFISMVPVEQILPGPGASLCSGCSHCMVVEYTRMPSSTFKIDQTLTRSRCRQDGGVRTISRALL